MITGVHVVIFDFDYTLFDTSAGVVACMRRAFDAHGLQVPSEDRIRQTIGLPLEKAIASFASTSPDTPIVADVARSFLEAADQCMVELTIPLASAPEALQALHAARLGLAIFTGKYRARVDRTLKKFGLDLLFDRIVCGDEAPAKPAPDGLREIMNAYPDLTAARFVFVGDHPVDIEAARNAGIGCIAVATGRTPSDELARHGPLGVIGSLRELPSVLLDTSRPQ